MPSKRRFYKTILQVEVLCEESPYEWDSLASVAHDITNGGCSGRVKEISSQRLNGQQAAKALQDQGSDPEFFQLDKNGNDLED